MSKQTILVLGAGGAGAKTASLLSKSLPPNAELLLVDSRGYYLHWPAMVRMVVTPEGKLEDTALIPLDKTLTPGKGSLVVGRAVQIVPGKDGKAGGEVVLESGERLGYDYLVLATGSIYEGPLAMPDKKEDVVRWANEWRERFDRAGSVLLVGGGAVGVEIAGEIKDCWPDKKVTLVQGDRALLNSAYPDKFRTALADRLKKRGIELIFSDYVDSIPSPGTSSTVTTRNGKTIQADLVVATRGGRPNTALIKAAFPDAVDQDGRVKVLPTLQLPGHPNVFAAGDITSLPEQKQVAKYPAHASLISSNILSLLSGHAAAKEYKKQPEMILVTVGKEGGAAYLGMGWGFVLGDWFARMLKSRDLLVGMARKELKYA